MSNRYWTEAEYEVVERLLRKYPDFVPNKESLAVAISIDRKHGAVKQKLTELRQGIKRSIRVSRPKRERDTQRPYKHWTSKELEMLNYEIENSYCCLFELAEKIHTKFGRSKLAVYNRLVIVNSMEEV
jgi:hypothetical protein